MFDVFVVLKGGEYDSQFKTQRYQIVKEMKTNESKYTRFDENVATARIINYMNEPLIIAWVMPFPLGIYREDFDAKYNDKLFKIVDENDPNDAYASGSRVATQTGMLDQMIYDQKNKQISLMNNDGSVTTYSLFP